MQASKDLLVFFAIASLPIASFLLLNYPDTQFYISMLLVSLVVIVWLEKHNEKPVVGYTENLTLEKLAIVLGGVLGCLAVSTFFTSTFLHSVLYVPTQKLDLTYGGFMLPAFWTDILFTFVLVVTAEECTKLVIILALYTWLRDRFGAGFSKWGSVAIAVGGWALLHTYSNPLSYGGPNGWVYLTAAAICGVIMFLVLQYTHSLLATMLVHFGYNATVLYMSYYPTAITVSVVAALFTMVCCAQRIRQGREL
jgi:membrane protease YdiL (CAAX protease family)